MPDTIKKDDLCCFCSDHSDFNIREYISDDEQIASLITNIKVASCQELSLECPLRVFIPYHYITESNRTIAVKVSITEEKWFHVKTLKPLTLVDKPEIMTILMQYIMKMVDSGSLPNTR